MRYAVVGASGRMGRAIVRLGREMADATLVAAVSEQDIGQDAGLLAGVGSLGVKIVAPLEALTQAGADVVIDFSAPAVTLELAPLLANAGVRLVSGTTGLGDEHKGALANAATQVAVLWEPNMSMGVHVLGRLVEQAVRALGPAYDIEIVETHHRMKIDAPSGTAILLAQKAKSAREDTTYIYGREGKPGARKPSEIAVLAMRGGDVIGDHSVHLMALGERLELTHRATNRDVFAHGALRAAAWMATRGPGSYSLADVIGPVLRN